MVPWSPAIDSREIPRSIVDALLAGPYALWLANCKLRRTGRTELRFGEGERCGGDGFFAWWHWFSSQGVPPTRQRPRTRPINARSCSSSSDTVRDVDRQLQTVDEKSHPGKYAQQFDRFASEARSHQPPSAQRQQFDVLLTAFDDAAQQYRSAQTALSSGNSDAYKAALKRAHQTMADRQRYSAAIRYAASRRLPQGTGRAAAEPSPCSGCRGLAVGA